MPVPSLESLIAQHSFAGEDDQLVIPSSLHRWWPECACGWGANRDEPTTIKQAWKDHAAHVAEVIRQHHTVTTVEQLEALPYESVVRSDEGCIWEKDPSGWYEPGARQECIAADIALPALVLWTPADGVEDQP
ncbi:hypothetical protein SEA_BUDSKI_90 [Gordonia phage Budski]|nr:hypothetical protein SEA_BUDSKI_90 [Gordonia phage Budski]